MTVGGIPISIDGLKNNNGTTTAPKEAIEQALKNAMIPVNTGSSGGGSGNGSSPQVTPTDLLAAVKMQYELAKQKNDTALMERLHQQAEQLRQQGASEKDANKKAYGSEAGFYGRNQGQSAGKDGNPAVEGASYWSTNGLAVAWAGNNKIFLFDQNGNPLEVPGWDGTGERRPDGRIVPPKWVQDQVGFGSAPLYGIGNPHYFCTDKIDPKGCRGQDQSNGGDFKMDQGTATSLSPFPDKPYFEGMQLVRLVVNGVEYKGYGNAYVADPSLKGGASMAIPATSELGKKLQELGWQVVDGQVRLRTDAPIQFQDKINWTRGTGAPGAGETNLGGIGTWGPGGGANILLQIGTSGNGGNGGNGDNGGPQDFAPTINSVAASPDPVVEGTQVTVTANISGTVTSVTATFSWGATVTMTDQGGGVWKATATTPLQPGPATVAVVAANGLLSSTKTASFTIAPAPAAITSVNFSANPAKFAQDLTVTVTTTGRVDRVTLEIPHRRSVTEPDYNKRYLWTLTRSGGTAPGAQTWTVTVKAGQWITGAELQVAFCQGDLSGDWSACRIQRNGVWYGPEIDPYTATITATGTGGTATEQRMHMIRGTTIWAVPVPIR